MKQIVLLILLLSVVTAALTGCAPPAGSQEAPDGRLSVVATIFAPYDFAREIAGDLANITMLIKPGVESHSFEPTPQETIMIQNCDVFIYVGGESDTWIEKILNSLETDGIRIVTLMDCVELKQEEIKEGMEADEEEHEEEGMAYDEHVWTAPQNAKLIVQKISDALCAADEANAAAYSQNTAAYLGKLNELDAAFQDMTAAAKRKTIVFGDRFPFRYLADAYGLDYFAAFPGCSAELEPSAQTVSFLIEKIREEEIPVVFHLELSNQKMADTLCEETGAKKMLLHACHNITSADFQAGAGYLELMTRNVETLREALS